MSYRKSPNKRIHEPLSWEVIVKYEPRLLNIVRRIEAIKAANYERKGRRKLSYGYATKCWYGYAGRKAIKAQLNNIIGWSSDTEYVELSGAEAHGICYSYLFDLLTN